MRSSSDVNEELAIMKRFATALNAMPQDRRDRVLAWLQQLPPAALVEHPEDPDQKRLF